MPLTISQIAAKYHIKPWLLRRMANDPEIDFRADDGEGFTEKWMQSAADLAAANRFNAFYLAVMCKLYIEGDRDTMARIHLNFPLEGERAQEANRVFSALQPGKHMTQLADAKRIVERVNLQDKDAQDILARWTQERLSECGTEVEGYWLAVRLMLSEDDLHSMASMSRQIVSAYNRLCGSKEPLLAGWFIPPYEGLPRRFSAPIW